MQEVSENIFSKLKKQKPIDYFLNILIIWLIYGSIALIFNISSSGGSVGTFGDAFGALNTLFTGFAFAGLIYSIYLQQQEMKKTTSEIEKQSSAILEQANAIAGQSKNIEKQTEISQQQLEISRSLLLLQRNQMSDNLLFNLASENNKAKDDDLMMDFSKQISNSLKSIREDYIKFFEESHNQLDSYARRFEHIIVYGNTLFYSNDIRINQNYNSESNDLELLPSHRDLIATYLTNNELVFLFYTAILYDSDYPRIKKMLEKNAFLRDLKIPFLDFKKIPNDAIRKNFITQSKEIVFELLEAYNPKAFGGEGQLVIIKKQFIRTQITEGESYLKAMKLSNHPADQTKCAEVEEELANLEKYLNVPD